MLKENDIASAKTICADFYTSSELFARCKEKLFAPSWQFLTDCASLKAPGHTLPINLLEGFLDEPLLLTRDSQDNLHCLANVCTHRGNLLIEGECSVTGLRCRYHGRRFALDGAFVSAPGFEDAADFPSPSDSLPTVPMEKWKTMLFAKAAPDDQLFPFADLVAALQERLYWLNLDEFVFEPSLSRDYLVNAHWALYCENYLEGLHIPYVHPSLATAVDTKNYKTEVFKYSSLQVGVANSPNEAFQLPSDSPDFGKEIAAYYFFLFPNMMFNFYPWGLSINVVKPLALERTRVLFLSYVFDQSKLGIGAGAAIDRVEREDEDIVEKCKRA